MYLKSEDKCLISQGDIYKDVEYPRWIDIEDKKIVTEIFTIPFIIVLTQDCDLIWDYKDREKEKDQKRDKYLQSVLVCPAYLAELLRAGKHLEELNLKMENFDSNRWKTLVQNKNSRYHFMKSDSTIGIPDLVIDFKHYYTIPTERLYSILKEHYIGSIKELFREDLSHRFAFYLSRIGLPI